MKINLRSLAAKKFFKKLLWALVIFFIVIQFFHPEKNISSTQSPNHITKQFTLPVEVEKTLKKSCGDCHSNNTSYPWYFNVQPVAWWLADHIEEGKREVNFDEFATYSLRRQFKKFKEIKEQVEEDEMPISAYTLLHRDAVLSAEQKQAVIKWTEYMMNEMKAKYPIDSLVRKEQKG
jgi:hypothetical protein